MLRCSMPTLNSPEQGFELHWTHHKPKLVAICEDNFSVITKMCLKRNRELAFSMTRIAREFDIPIVVNSSDASDRAYEYLSSGADCDHRRSRKYSRRRNPLIIWVSRPPESRQVAGLSYLDPKLRAIFALRPARQLETELSRFPLPAWDLSIWTPTAKNGSELTDSSASI